MTGDEKEMQDAMERSRKAQLDQIKTNAPFRERIVSLIKEADSRGLFDK